MKETYIHRVHRRNDPQMVWFMLRLRDYTAFTPFSTDRYDTISNAI